MEILVQHVMPVGDIVEHEPDELCICGPTGSERTLVLGRLKWLFVHHSLDGREQTE